MRIFITGLEGFAGSHLADYACQHKTEVQGSIRPGAAQENLRHLTGVKAHRVDIRDKDKLKRLLCHWQPQKIFHLAGQSNVVASQALAEETLSTHILGTLNLLEICRHHLPQARLLIVSSAKVYGKVKTHDLPVRETAALGAKSIYGVSKVCQDLLAQYYSQQYGLYVVRLRPFNHIGPRQAPSFVCSDFARQIALMEAGQQAPWLQVGDLDVKIDLSDVRDVVRGYWLALAQGKAGEAYNICSGRAVSVKEIVKFFLTKTSQKIKIHMQKQRRRQQENPIFYGSYEKLYRQTHWQPRHALEATLQTVLDYWREKVSAPGCHLKTHD